MYFSGFSHSFDINHLVLYSISLCSLSLWTVLTLNSSIIWASVPPSLLSTDCVKMGCFHFSFIFLCFWMFGYFEFFLVCHLTSLFMFPLSRALLVHFIISIFLQWIPKMNVSWKILPVFHDMAGSLYLPIVTVAARRGWCNWLCHWCMILSGLDHMHGTSPALHTFLLCPW